MIDADTPYNILSRLTKIPWLMILLLISIGMIGVGAQYSVGSGWNPWAQSQILRFGLCFVALLVLVALPIRVLQLLALPAYFFGIALLVLIIFMGDQQMGARRWLRIGSVNLQASEFLKIGLVMGLASYYQQMTIHEVSRIRFALVPMLMIAVPVFLVFLQPDLGTALLIAMLGGAIMFLAGTPIWLFATGAGLGMIAIPLGWLFFLHDYQKQRILTFWDPQSDHLGGGYHILQSQIAIGSGGWAGRGYDKGPQTQLNFLPETHTDFIYTTIAEEWGLLGVLVVLAAYLLLVGLGLIAGWRCISVFGRLLCYGITINMSLYVFTNMAMVSGLIPVVGVPLPLVSYGGSVMMAVLMGYGLVCVCVVDRKIILARY